MACNNIIGEMRNRVEVQKVTRTSDGQGGFDELWTTIATVWAKIEPLKAYEKFQASQMGMIVNNKITIRYISSITPDCRLMINGVTHEIKSIIES